jgi:YhcH/YjgK/YiaL family protein
MKWYIETAEVVRYGVTGIPIIIRQRDRGDGSVIVDTLNNSSLYRGLSPRIALAFDYLCGSDLRDAAAGTFEIDGTRVYAIIQDYISLPLLQGAWEAHRHYIDLQYVIAGTERMGHAHISRLAPGAYDPTRDVLPLAGEGDFLTLGPGDFMLLFPADAHMPRIAVGAPAPVRKVVVKIAVDP